MNGKKGVRDIGTNLLRNVTVNAEKNDKKPATIDYLRAYQASQAKKKAYQLRQTLLKEGVIIEYLIP